MLGKQKCKILKEIRQKIADENDIPYVTRECSYQGDCRGTCPRCESELRYLEQQLAKRQALGKRVTVVALCAGMTLGAAGCAPFAPKPTPAPVVEELSGAMPYDEPIPTPTEAPEPETGEALPPEDPDALPPEGIEPVEIEFELAGDVPYFPEEQNG